MIFSYLRSSYHFILYKIVSIVAMEDATGEIVMDDRSSDSQQPSEEAEHAPDAAAAVTTTMTTVVAAAGDDGDNSSNSNNDDTIDTTTRSGKKTTRTHRRRCGQCPACLREDCGTCEECCHKKKFGGDGSSKQACLHRRCQNLQESTPPRTTSNSSNSRSFATAAASSNGGSSGGILIKKRSRSSTEGSGGGVGDGVDPMSSAHQWPEEYPSTREAMLPLSASVPAPAPSPKKARKSSSKKRGPTVDEQAIVQQLISFRPPSLLASTHVLESLPAFATTETNYITRYVHPANKGDLRYSTTQLLKDYKYGMPVQDPALEVCAGCRRVHAPRPPDADVLDPTQPPPEPVILLCDGPNCGSEYHLECCIPPISEIPEGAYYCVDCNPHGSSAILEQYLEDHDERRAMESSYDEDTDANSKYAFLTSLWKEDLEDNQDNWNDEKQQNNGEQRVPQSELARLLDLQQHLVGSPAAGRPCSFQELGDLFVGKPVRLYGPLDDNYHSGRIVDYRPITIGSSGSKKPKKPISSTSSQQRIYYYPNDDFFATKVEFLVRFVPGSHEYRKTLIHRWIRLEEHSLAVGTHLIWGNFSTQDMVASAPGTVSARFGNASTTNGSEWQPALLFLRATRELIPVLHLLQEEDGEISFHPASLMQGSSGTRPKKNSDKSTFAVTVPAKPPKKVWALAKRLANSSAPVPVPSPSDNNEDQTKDQAYKLLRINLEAKAFMSRKPTSNHLDRLNYSLAMAEYDEQQTVIRWQRMPLQNKWAPTALRSRDAFSMGPVEFRDSTHTSPVTTNTRAKSQEEQELCPLIRSPGLDRTYLMERLVQRGIVKEASKDIAAGLECVLIP